METKEQAAQKYAEMSTLNPGADRTKRSNAFLAGVEWAQRWIAPETELPPAEKVLAKDNNGDTYTIDWRGKSPEHIKNAVHYWHIILWRSIEK